MVYPLCLLSIIFPWFPVVDHQVLPYSFAMNAIMSWPSSDLQRRQDFNNLIPGHGGRLETDVGDGTENLDASHTRRIT